MQERSFPAFGIYVHDLQGKLRCNTENSEKDVKPRRLLCVSADAAVTLATMRENRILESGSDPMLYGNRRVHH